MNTKAFLTVICIMALIASGCKQATRQIDNGSQLESAPPQEQEEVLTTEALNKFIPNGYVFYSEVWGDLNKDGMDDCVLIIKATDPDGFVTDEYTGETIDRNRRGVVIVFKNGENYDLMLKNADFFESENEDGGVYYAPILSWEINRGNLIFSYECGRYGGRKYTFRYQNNDFELIGFDEYVGSLQYSKTEYSINFLTKKMKTTIYDEREDEAEPKYEPKTQWENIKVDKLYKLSEGTIENVFDYVFDNFIYVKE